MTRRDKNAAIKALKEVHWVIRWRDRRGWQYHPETFSSITKAQKVAESLPIAWPIDLVPELRAA